MTPNHVVVPTAWMRGEPCRRGALWTDGHTLFSYDHIIGTTIDGGHKVAYDCHASTTTARHSGGARRVANMVELCSQHPPGGVAHRPMIDGWASRDARGSKEG